MKNPIYFVLACNRYSSSVCFFTFDSKRIAHRCAKNYKALGYDVNLIIKYE